MKIGITGANGWLGQAVAKAAIGRGHRVRSIVRSASRPTVMPSVVDELRFWENIADIDRLFNGCDVIVNCAARVHVTAHEDYHQALSLFRRDNRDLAVEFARRASDAGVGRFVQISSVAAIRSVSSTGETITDETPPNPDRPYGIAKLEADELLGAMKPDLQVLSIRPPAIFGEGVSAFFAMLAQMARRGVPLPIGALKNRRSFAYLGNIADAVLTGAESKLMGAYIVTDSAPISTPLLYRQMLVAACRRPIVPSLPTMISAPLFQAVLKDRVTSLTGSAAYSGVHFARESGWTPSTSFETGIMRTMREVMSDTKKHGSKI